jgi:hypothetical protein
MRWAIISVLSQGGLNNIHVELMGLEMKYVLWLAFTPATIYVPPEKFGTLPTEETCQAYIESHATLPSAPQGGFDGVKDGIPRFAAWVTPFCRPEGWQPTP